MADSFRILFRKVPKGLPQCLVLKTPCFHCRVWVLSLVEELDPASHEVWQKREKEKVPKKVRVFDFQMTSVRRVRKQ